MGLRGAFFLVRYCCLIGQQIFGDPLDGPGKVVGLAFGTAGFSWSDFFELLDGDFVFRTGVPDRFFSSGSVARPPPRVREPRRLRAGGARVRAAGAGSAAAIPLAAEAPVLRGRRGAHCVTNERIIRESGFEDVYIMPAAEDSGTAIGAAYYSLSGRTGVDPSAGTHVGS